jgi:hypothetical protein
MRALTSFGRHDSCGEARQDMRLGRFPAEGIQRCEDRCRYTRSAAVGDQLKDEANVADDRDRKEDDLDEAEEDGGHDPPQTRIVESFSH